MINTQEMEKCIEIQIADKFPICYFYCETNDEWYVVDFEKETMKSCDRKNFMSNLITEILNLDYENSNVWASEELTLAIKEEVENLLEDARRNLKDFEDLKLFLKDELTFKGDEKNEKN